MYILYRFLVGVLFLFGVRLLVGVLILFGVLFGVLFLLGVSIVILKYLSRYKLRILLLSVLEISFLESFSLFFADSTIIEWLLLEFGIGVFDKFYVD